MDMEIQRASKKRLLLSWYIDFLLFMTLWGLFSYLLDLDARLPFWTPYLLFIAIRAISARYIGSVAHHFLSIDKETEAVAPDIFRRENWLTMLLGVLLILEGTKKLVRWTQVLVPEPLFGFIPDDPTQITVHVLLGASSLLAGYWFLKLNIKGLYLAASIMLVNIISDTLSWRLWDPVIARMVVEHRALQGRAVREEEISFMQAIYPEGMILLAAIAIIAMLFTYQRLKRSAE